MQVNIVPGQSGGAITAALYNANSWALANAIAVVEEQIAGVVRDLHGEGVLRGLQPIAGTNFVTIVPGVGFVNGIRIVLPLAANCLTPAYSVARVWLYDYSSEPVIMTVPADEITWNDNAPNITYSGGEMGAGVERKVEAGTYNGHYTELTDGTATVTYSGEGPLRLVYRRASTGGTGVITYRALNDDGSWGEWTTGTGVNSINFAAGSTSYGAEIVIAEPDPDGRVKEVKLTTTGEGYIEAFRYLAPNDDAPSDNTIDLCWVYTRANGSIISMRDTRRHLTLSEYWESLIATKYKLLASTILCTNFWGDGFGSLLNIGDGTTAYIDTSLHQAVMASLSPYPVAQAGEADLLGQGTQVTQRIVLTQTPVQLSYGRIGAASVSVEATDATPYATGYVVDYNEGTIAWDVEANPNPIAEEETVDVTYLGLSVVTLTARVPGSGAVYGLVKRGSTAEHTGASALGLDKLGNSVFAFTPKTGIEGGGGNALEVLVEDADNIRETMAFSQFQDRGIPAHTSMELKSKILGTEGNLVRGSIAVPAAQRLLNTSFDANADEWTMQDNSLGSWATDNTQHYAGAASLKCQKTTVAGTMRSYRTFDAKPGLGYRATLYFRSDICELNVAGYLRIMSADRSVQVGSFKFLDSASRNDSDWTLCEVDFTCPSTMNRLAFVVDVADDTGSVWVDDCGVITLSDDAFRLFVEDGHLTPWYTPLVLSAENITVSDVAGDKGNVIDADNDTAWQGILAAPWLAYTFATQPTTVTGVSIFVAPGALSENAAVALDRQDAGGNWLEVASGAARNGWLALRLPGTVAAYALRVRTTAPIAELRIYGNVEKATPEPMSTPLLSNLLVNPSFEGWETRSGKTQPVAWTRRINGSEDDGAYTEVSNTVLLGLKSAADSANTANVGTYTSTDMTLKANRVYMAAVYVKVPTINGATVKAELQPVDGSGNAVGTPIPLVVDGGATSITAACDWTLLALKHTATTARARIILTRDGEASAAWDGGVVSVCREIFDQLTLDTHDAALGWEVPYGLATSVVNGSSGSELVQVVNLTTDPGYEHTGVDKNPDQTGFVNLGGGGTEQTTVKLTFNRYALDDDGLPTQTVISTETFNNLTVAANDVPGGFAPSNRALVATINTGSSLLNVAFAGNEASATWAGNPENGSTFLTGGITQHETLDLSLMSLSRSRVEIESASIEGAITIQRADWSVAVDANASEGEYITGTGASGDVAYVYIQGPVARLYLGYRIDPSFGILSLALAEYDEDGNLGDFAGDHSYLSVSSVDQSSGTPGWKRSTLVAQGLIDTYANGQPKLYCLRVTCTSGVCNLDFIDADIVTYTEEYRNLAVVPAIYSEAGKSPLHHVINSGYGSQGPSALVTASTTTYRNITDNPDLVAFWITGTEGSVAILESPVFDCAPLAYWDRFMVFCDYYTPEGSSVTFEYTTNPLDGSPSWTPFLNGSMVMTSAVAGDNLLQIRAVLSTRSATVTPIIYDWGLFWGETVYAPAGARLVTEEGQIYIQVTGEDTASITEEGFHPLEVLTAGSGTHRLAITSTPTRVLLEIEEVYVGPYNEETGWPSTETGLSDNKVTVNDQTVEVYAVGSGRGYATLFYRLPVGWQAKVKWVAEGYM